MTSFRYGKYVEPGDITSNIIVLEQPEGYLRPKKKEKGRAIPLLLKRILSNYNEIMGQPGPISLEETVS